ncbi:MAG: carboxypeptidase regulatory-like domain-containing protein, partial [Bacteroidales bacterium]|nr:carboxypeptidase regulatory-like domain-containing protein [Bacteroidales bacterium]
MNPTLINFRLTLLLLLVTLLSVTRSITAQNLCEPLYNTGCSDGDGFTDFAFAEIENYGSDCANLNGTGWSQYLGLGPAILLPGETYDMTMQTGYSNQKVSVWIDFNDDFDLSADEQVLFDFELPQANQFFTAQITIPIDALPGQHYLRARTNWSGSCDDPCENYNYGEAEDYYVFIGDGNFGNLEGNISQFSGGSPVENAMISLFGEFLNYQTSSGADGYYLIENILAGEYQVVCSAEGYNEITDTVLIIEDVVITKNFQLTQPSISVSPQNVTVTIDQNNTTLEYLTLENTGNGPLNWSASLLILSEKSKDYLDLQFEYPTSGTSGEWGIESDGEFIYTTSWTSNQFLKYDQQGNFVESFTISGVTGIRDLAYDGMYFYGSAGIPVVFKMDFMNKELLATFDAPANVRSIAYNHDENIFYAGSWNDEIVVFDTAGTLINTLITGPVGGVYNGLAYDNVSPGGPFLWGYGAA